MRIGVSLDDRVGNVADTVGHAARVFEVLAIDYCDRRERTLRDAASATLRVGAVSVSPSIDSGAAEAATNIN